MHAVSGYYIQRVAAEAIGRLLAVAQPARATRSCTRACVAIGRIGVGWGENGSACCCPKLLLLTCFVWDGMGWDGCERQYAAF